MNNKKDLSKELLYESVKTLLEQDHPHLHLHQHKLFTLFSIGLQYFLYLSTKKPGFYIIRIEDSFLADKLCRRAKDYTTRKFLEKILLPRKLTYNQSTFFLDYFHINSWFLTNDLPKNKIQGAIIVKDSTSRPLIEDLSGSAEEISAEEETHRLTLKQLQESLPKDYYFSFLQEVAPRTLIISYDHEYEDTTKISFPFIKDQEKVNLHGVTLSENFKSTQWKEV